MDEYNEHSSDTICVGIVLAVERKGKSRTARRVEGSQHTESRLLLVGMSQDEVNDIEAQTRACHHCLGLSHTVRHVRGGAVQCSAMLALLVGVQGNATSAVKC
jgi:hypothetical protein